MNLEKQIKKEFMRILKSEQLTKKFQDLRSKYKVPKIFGTPGEVHQFLHNKNNGDYHTKDFLFKALIIEQRAGQDEYLTIFLIGLLLPGLRGVFYRLSANTDELEADELWSQIITFCLEHIEQYNFTRRPKKIAKNIVMDTFNSTLRWLEREQDYYKTKCPLEDACLIERLVFDHHFNSKRDVDLTPEELLATLTDLGVISADNLYLVTATRIDGKTLRALAKELNQNYDIIRKRHHRTTQAIMRFLKRDNR